MNERLFEHPSLGHLHWDESLAAWSTAVELHPACPFQLLLITGKSDAEAIELELFELGVVYLNWAREAEQGVRERIAADLLTCYNQVWADDDPTEGMPPMTRAEFLSHLHLEGITLHQDGSASWYYGCGELFGGHSIFLDLDPQRAFEGQASLFG